MNTNTYYILTPYFAGKCQALRMEYKITTATTEEELCAHILQRWKEGEMCFHRLEKLSFIQKLGLDDNCLSATKYPELYDVLADGLKTEEGRKEFLTCLQKCGHMGDIHEYGIPDFYVKKGKGNVHLTNFMLTYALYGIDGDECLEDEEDE